MSILVPINICIALWIYPMFIISFHRREPFVWIWCLLVFVINFLAALYSILLDFHLLKL